LEFLTIAFDEESYGIGDVEVEDVVEEDSMASEMAESLRE